MKYRFVSTIAAFLSLTSASAAADPVLLEGCRNQCWAGYQDRSGYCYARHGNSYEAELCMMNVYDEYQYCLQDCESTYGGQASLNLQSKQSRGAKCSRVANS